MDTKDSGYKTAAGYGGWSKGDGVKGSSDDLRRSAAALRDQVAKEARLLAQHSHGECTNKKK
jgi:hypothetical protein